MTSLPVSATRTSTALTTQRLLNQVNNDQIGLQQQLDQLSTGRRVLSLSDDPAAAGRAIGLQREIDRTAQLSRNATSATSFFQAADTSLSRVNNALIEARGVAVTAAQSVISQDERAGLAATIEETINSVFAAGNSLFRDQQLLGGSLGSGPPFERIGNEVVFDGNLAISQARVGAGVPLPVNVNANEALGAANVFLEGEPLNAALDAQTRLVDLRSGLGVDTGVVTFASSNESVEIDFSSAATIGDVATLINGIELEGRPLSATLTDDGIRVEYTDGLSGILAISDASGSTTAQDLAISNPAGVIAPPIIGDRLSPSLTSQTLLSDLNDGAGVELSEGILLAQGSQEFAISFAGLETIGDVIIEINRSGADVRAELNQAEGRIQLRSLRSGVDYSIGENGGDDAEQLGIRSATAATRLTELNGGQGVVLNQDGPDLTIVRPDSVELDLDLEGLENVQDVIDLIINHPLNQDAQRVLVSLNEFGNGIQLSAPPGAGQLTIRQNGISDAGTQLGLIPPDSLVGVGQVVGAVDTIVGADFAPRNAGGALDTLIRLRDAVLEGDLPEIARLQTQLDADLDQASQVRGQLGIWTRNVSELQEAVEINGVQLQEQLSNEIDADLATVISDLNQQQVAIEASLRVIGQTSQLTVLNFL